MRSALKRSAFAHLHSIRHLSEELSIALASIHAKGMETYPVTDRRAFLGRLGVPIAHDADIKAAAAAEKQKNLDMRIAKLCKGRGMSRADWDLLKS